MEGKAAEPSFAHKAIGGLLWTSYGQGAQAVLQVVVLATLARLLVPEDFGIVAAALVVTRFSEIFSQLGVGAAIVQQPDLEERHIETGFGISVLLGFVCAAAVLALAEPLDGFFRIEGLAPYIRALAITFPILGVSTVASGLLRRNLRFRDLARIQVLSYCLGYAVVGIGLGFLGFGAWALVGATIAEAVITAFLKLAAQPHSKRLRFRTDAARELLYFGAGHSSNRIANFFALQGDYLIIGRFLGATPLGLYERAYRVMNVPAKVLGSVLERVLFPSMASIQEDTTRLRDAYRKSVAFVALTVLPVSAFSILVAPELIRVALGPGWSEAVVPFQILTLGMYFRTAYKVGNAVARATGAVYRGAWRQAVYAILVVAGALVGQRWGVNGVAVGVLFALVGIFLLNAHLGAILTRLTWSEFGRLHLPATGIALLLGVQTWGVVTLMRAAEAGAFFVLAGATLAGGVTLLVLALRAPERALGPDGAWMLRTFREYVEGHVTLPRWVRREEGR